MLLYPLAIVLIIMALFEKAFGKSQYVYVCVTIFTAIPAIFDFCKTLPEGIQNALNIPAMTDLGSRIFPFFNYGLGWVVPALIGLAIGLALTAIRKNKGAAA